MSKITVYLVPGFSPSTLEGTPFVDGQEYEQTEHVDNLIRIGLLSQTPADEEPDEEPEGGGPEGGSDPDPDPREEARKRFDAMKKTELQELAKAAELEVPSNANKDAIVEILVEAEFAEDDDDEEGAQ